MPISQSLMLAILSMDSYNRGLSPGLDLAAAGASSTTIGNATIRSDALPSGSLAAGFFAQAYNWNGQKIISYRGTDNPSLFQSASGVSDVLNGWLSGVGVTNSSTDLALKFYKDVTGLNYGDGAASNTILTGHSLGGGLAAFVASLSGTQAVVFDHMPFE